MNIEKKNNLILTQPPQSGSGAESNAVNEALMIRLKEHYRRNGFPTWEDYQNQRENTILHTKTVRA